MLGDTILDLEEGEGTISLSERGERDKEHEFYTSIYFMDDKNALDVVIRAGMENDFQSIFISLSVHNAENIDTGRTFHASLTRNLDWEEAKLLHSYLGFLLDSFPPK